MCAVGVLEPAACRVYVAWQSLAISRSKNVATQSVVKFQRREADVGDTPDEIEIDPQRFMTMAQVAVLWNSSVDTVRRRIRSGSLPTVPVGRGVRIRREDALKGAK